MQVFDRVDPGSLERREWSLWLLALSVIMVLVVGMGLLMYPTVFADPVILSGITLRKFFFGFCALAILLVGYLVDRQIEISQLRRRLVEEQKLIVRIRHEASTDLLGTLPGFDHLRDRLAMEYRRAVTLNRPLTALIVALKATRDLANTPEALTAFGDAARALVRKLRTEDSIYLLGPGVFCMILPGVEANDAYRIANRHTEGLQDAAGASARFTFEIRVINYPEHAATATEIEKAVRAFVSNEPASAMPSVTGEVPTESS